ncbi:MAG: N(4)-(beta-N-acetylglucosaminyl)-L-asparaginase [Pseudoxanthomonas sp.]
MIDRRHLLASFCTLAAVLPGRTARASALAAAATAHAGSAGVRPRVVSTWDFGIAANQAAWQVLAAGGHALDAVERGVQVPESDLRNHSVGKGGYPDRNGIVTLDASIMDERGNCGAVAALERIAHPISVARAVMEKTPHVLLAGAGALQFAREQDFPEDDLLTPEAEQAWHEWLQHAHYSPRANSEVRDYDKLPGGADNHDTIGMLALDAQGRLCGACTTSGMAWKLHGRVGDSPIIGAGLYVDGEVGGATSTGVGEEVIRNAGSFLVVELMRQGRDPQDACREAVERIARKRPDAAKTLQVGFLALDRDGRYSGYALQPGFNYAVCDADDQARLVPAASLFPAST